MIYSFSDYIKCINEGLIKTYDIDITIDKSDYFLSKLKIKYSIEKNISNDKIHLLIQDFNLIFNNLDILDNIETYFINISGWFPSSISIENIHGMENRFLYDKNYLITNSDFIKNLKITFESKFDKEYNLNSMYHLSIKQFKNDILKKGIIPKDKSKKTIHPNRIYLSDTIQGCINLIPQMNVYYSELKYKNRNLKINSDWIIYEIDTKSIILYKDPNYINGYYTTNNIPPNKIKIVDEK